MAYSVFRIPNSLTVTPSASSNVVQILQGASGQSVDLTQWQNYLGTVLARVDNAGNISGVGGTFSSDLAVNGSNLTTTAATFNLANTNLTTLNLGGSANTINFGKSTGTGILNGNLTLGTSASNTLTFSGVPTFTQASVFQNNVTVSGALTAVGNVTLGDAAGDTITVSGTPTFVQNATFSGDIAVNGGDITTTSSAFNFANSATTLNLGTGSTTVNIGSIGTTNVNTLTATGAINANNGTIATNQTTANLLNTTATTINFGGASTSTNIGAAGGTVTILGTTAVNILTATGNINANGGTIATSQTTANLLNTTATTVNAFGAATTTNIGAANGTVNIGGTTAVNILTATGTINANGGTIATNQTTANLLNTTATTINFGGAATTMNIANGTITSGVVNIGTNNTSGTITLGTSTTNTVIQGNLTVNGTTTTVNSTVISTQDLNFNVASNATTTTAANNAGLIVGSGLNITWYYDSTNAAWTSSENINAASTKTFKIAGTDVLSATTLGTNVINSSLQRVGTIATGVWNGTAIGVAYGGTNLTSYAVGDLIYASATTTLSKLAAVASGQFLVSNGVSTAPSYRSLTTPDITGALGYTPANSGSTVTGTGAANKIAIWSSTTNLTNDTDLGYDSTNNILSIGYGNINAAAADVTVGTSVAAIDSFSATTYRSAKYLIQTKNSGGTIHQISEALIIHDGTTAYLTEYGQIYTSGTAPLVTLSCDINTGNVRLLGVGSAAGNTVRFVKTFVNA